MFSELPFRNHAGNNVSKIAEQYRQMPFVDWKEEAPFKKDGFPVDTEQFWICVFQNKAFKEFANFALTCPITPASNAAVKRIFLLYLPLKRRQETECS
jgi:hypothetical protein